MSRKPYDTPAEATAENGEVMIDGPDGIAVSLTPKAAHESARKIERAAGQAEAQDRPAPAGRAGAAGD